MAARTRARNPNELTEIINRAVDEVEDLRAAIEYDEEFKGESSIIVEPVAAGLTRLLSAINNANYQPGEGGLAAFPRCLARDRSSCATILATVEANY